ncbi:MAG TPA: sulfotransferase [Actinomycetota bacterium]
MSRGVQAPSFLIVGTPRSGTTLVQRLACELPGVRVPIETHFFAQFYPERFRWRFPLQGNELREAVGEYASMKNLREAALAPERVADRLDDRADGPLALFDAVVRELAGEADTYGEKTPTHLPWVRPLTRAMPGLRVIAVVRDPRAVVSSTLELPWGPKRPEGYAVVAQRWLLDQRELAKARDALGRERFLLLRYEDVVADPGVARGRIAALIDVADEGRAAPKAGDIVLPRESWKARATERVTDERVRAWEQRLSDEQVRTIEAIAGRELGRLGYGAASPRRPRAALPPAVTVARLRFALRYRWDLARIRRTRVW